jgi:leucyl aminopeptidase
LNIGTSATHLSELGAPLVAVAAFQDDDGFGADFAALDAVAGGRIAAIAAEEQFKGRAGQQLVVHLGGRIGRALVVGAGKRSEFNTSSLRQLAAQAVEEADRRRLSGATVVVPESLQHAEGIKAAAFGARLGLYRYVQWRTVDVEAPTVESFGIATPGKAVDGAQAAVELASIEAGAVAMARDLVNGPPAEITPRALAAVAERIGREETLEVEVFDEHALRGHGMNLLLAVGAASTEPPRLIRLTWRPPGATATTPVIALVGKGITFDSGGYNIKPTGSMEDMKIDMAGAAAVLGAMKAVAKLRPNAIVHGLVPAAENLVSGAGYKPGDVIRSYNGKTVEIMNTDAEGRLILADALAWAVKLGATRIVDLATLTGACMIALGPNTAGLFSNDDAFRAQVQEAAKKAGEDVWPMPLTAKLRGMLKSPIADMKNIGERWGGAITAALFLKEFIGDATWAHLDIAGPASNDKPEPGMPRGGTGFGVMTLIELLRNEV